MNAVDLIQGSAEWHAHRAQHDNASDAPAMMGCSPYETRTEALHRLATGITPVVDAATQARFAEGHRCEALARPLAEAIIGEPLYPVTGTKGRRSASFDGLTLSERKNFEHKMLNDRLRAVMVDGCTGADLPLDYRVQMEQQSEISGCEETLFMATKWKGDTLLEERHCWYKPDLALREQINAGWDQFNKDRASYVPLEVIDKPVAKVVTSLPSVSVQVSGALVVRDNFGKFEAALRRFIDTDLIVDPKTDQDFADMAAQITALKGAEEALDAAETQMLSQVESVDLIRRTKETLHKLARDNRLAAQKRLEARKLAIKGEIVAEGVTAFRAHIDALNNRLGKPYMPAVAADFGGVIKNLRTVESLRNAVETELARAKIAANEIAERIDANLKHLREHAADYVMLFADTATIVLKASDDLQILVSSRINEHKAKEAAKLEAERERIRAEEAAKLRREAEEAAAKKAAEDAVAERQAQAAIAAATAPAPAPSPAPVARRPMSDREWAALPAGDRELPHAEVYGDAAPAPARTVEEKPALKLGEISARLGFTVTAEFLEGLGYAAHIERSSKLYRESEFPALCDAIRAHITGVRELHAYNPRQTALA